VSWAWRDIVGAFSATMPATSTFMVTPMTGCHPAGAAGTAGQSFRPMTYDAIVERMNTLPDVE
jgi:hypothetical protein